MEFLQALIPEHLGQKESTTSTQGLIYIAKINSLFLL
jgi:hypothetical protein